MNKKLTISTNTTASASTTDSLRLRFISLFNYHTGGNSPDFVTTQVSHWKIRGLKPLSLLKHFIMDYFTSTIKKQRYFCAFSFIFLFFTLLTPTSLSAQFIDYGWTQKGEVIKGEFAGEFAGSNLATSADGTVVAYGALVPYVNSSALLQRVRVYKFAGGAWTRLGADITEVSEFNTGFGSSIALSADGTTLAVSAPAYRPISPNPQISNRGYVKVFKFANGVWTQQGTTLVGIENNAGFGSSVVLSGDGKILAVSSPLADGTKGEGSSFTVVKDLGQVDLYEWNGDWSPYGTLKGLEPSQEFGSTIALSTNGKFLAASSNKTIFERDNVRVFEISSKKEIGGVINGEKVGEGCGSSLSFSADGMTLAVGSDEGGDNMSGHARVFKLSGSRWTQQGATIKGKNTGDRTGDAISLSADGSIVAVGSRFHSSYLPGDGKVQVYKFRSGIWAKKGGLLSGDDDGVRGGSTVALSADGETVVFGAPGSNTSRLTSGKIWVYSASCTTETPSVAISANPRGSIQSGTSVTFVAKPTEGGVAPIYQWKKNGIKIDIKGNNDVYIDSTLVNGDVISCDMMNDDGCADPLIVTSNAVTMTVISCTSLTAYNVTGGGGSFCAGGAGGAVGLSGSQLDVTYQLKDGIKNIGNPVAGTGSAITFGVQTKGATYTVIATRASDNCTVTMTGSAAVTENLLPTLAGESSVTIGTTRLWIGSGTPATSNPYVSSNPSVATVRNNGSVKGVSLGTAIITYTNEKGCQITKPVTVRATASPEMTIKGNAVAIDSGSTTPSLTNHTDFGKQSEVSGTVVRTFTIDNIGSAELELTGTPKVSISGADASDFTVTTQPTSPLNIYNGTTSFQITFDPSAVGLRTAIVSIATNQPDGSPFTFAIQGTGISAPAMIVKGNTVAIPNGSTVPSVANYTDFGAVLTHSDTRSRTFRIESKGARSLNLTGTPKIAVSGTHAHNFEVHTQPPSPISSDQDIYITFIPTASGLRTATVTIENDDPENNPYTFAIQGTGVTTKAPEMNVTGNSMPIVSGSTTASRDNHTDFGELLAKSGTVVRTFTIENLGADTLKLWGTTKVTVNNPNFEVLTQPASTIAPGSSTTFQISFDPSVVGTAITTVSIDNNDANENPYTFIIQGRGTQLPFITIWDMSKPGTSSSDISLNVTTTNALLWNGYTWRTLPAGKSGSGIFNTNSQVYISGLPTDAIIELSINSENLSTIAINDGKDKSRLIDIKQWGDVAWTSMDNAFRGCNNLNITATDVPNLSAVTSMLGMFWGCSSLKGPSNIGSWNTTAVKYMSNMFYDATVFNQPISTWNTTSVIEMRSMFFGTKAFNQPLSTWNIGAVTSMYGMFDRASAFNQSLAAWGTKFNTAVDLTTFLDNCGMSVANYDATLTGFKSGTVTGRKMGATGLLYCASATDRANLTGAKNWTITGDVLQCGNEIDVTGNSVSITNGSTIPTLANHTDFGLLKIGVGTVVRTFTIKNKGAATLNVTGTPKITISGTNASDFTITTQPTSPIAPSESTSFQITFNPSQYGVRSATVSIANDDANENPYTFDIQGTGSGEPFITVWDLSKTGLRSTELHFNIGLTATTNYTWKSSPSNTTGSGTISNPRAIITGLPQGEIIELSIEPAYLKSFSLSGDKRRLTDVKQWGNAFWSSMKDAFTGGVNLNITATDVPNFSAVTDMSGMFKECSSLIGTSNIGSWNTAAVKDMSEMFYDAAAFNQPIGSWNTAAVTDMYGMFYGATAFNQPIGDWDVAKVQDMWGMFRVATAFNQPIGAWNTANVRRMSYMFGGATTFNQPIGSWNTAAVREMTFMFASASAFNQPIGSWNTAAVGDMTGMFTNTPFNQPIGSWKTAAVINMSEMFANTPFNQPIGSWNTAAVEDMRNMFANSAFNQPIGSWDIANVKLMSNMFSNSTAFNQSLADWGKKLTTGADLSGFLDNCGMDFSNYDATLTGFNAGTATDISMGAMGRKYCNSATARANLVNTTSGGKNWTITGDALQCTFPQMKVKGNTVLIPDNDASPSLADHTDFGSQYITSGTVVRTFTIENTGVAALSLTGTPRVVIDNATNFTVTTQPPSSIAAANGTTTFQITFKPLVVGLVKATVSIENNSDTQNPYNFTIQGTGLNPEIVVNGNSVEILDGATTPSLTNHTDFGTQLASSGTVVRTFTIDNTETGDLILTGTPKVVIGGTHAADFKVTTQPNSPIAEKTNTTFQITFDPSALGLRTATVSIANNDRDENPYNFTIQGTGTGPEIAVKGNTVLITDGATTPSLTNHTDFGTQFLASGALVRTFTIENTAEFDLNLTGTPKVVIGGTHAADFVVTTEPNSLVAPKGTTTFQISFTPSVAGLMTATVSLANDDMDENPYNFAIQGTGALAPEMSVKGNGIEIPDGVTTALLADGTDFGTQSVGSSTMDRTFTIDNTGQGVLTLTGTPKVVLSGIHAGDFKVTTQPASSVAATNGTTTFQIIFTPSASGTRTATVSIANNDADENPYNFEIQGRGIIAPEINLKGNSITILNGASTPSLANHTDFGKLLVSSGTLVRTFTIENQGSAILNLTGTPQVVIGGTHAADFTVTTQPSSSVAIAKSTTYQISFTPSVSGLRTATVSIANDDEDENPYSFTIQGTGAAPQEMEVKGNLVVIPDGSTTPSLENHTDFGEQSIISGAITRTFTIKNTGGLDLNLTGTPRVVISGTNAADFTVTTQPNSPVTGLDSVTFQVSFDPSVVGLKTANISIANDDTDENPYNFAIQGTGRAPKPFITIWDLSKTGSGATELSFPVENSGVVSYTWKTIPASSATGSGTFTNTPYITGLPAGATIELSIDPVNFKRIKMFNAVNSTRLTDVKQWGDVNWSSMEEAFWGCENLNITATDLPNLTAVKSMAEMFSNCTSLNGPKNIGDWNTANVTTMNDMFAFATEFNQPIGDWNTANVKNMTRMFSGAYKFDQDISNWNTANVTGMYSMFSDAIAFNQPIGSWNTANVIDMGGMFGGATAFNQPIGSWDIGKVINMEKMFWHANTFNQSLAAWGTKFNANVNLNGFLDNCGMDIANYDATLTGFKNGTVTGRTMWALNLKYCAAAADRAILTKSISSGGKGWFILFDAEKCAITTIGTLTAFSACEGTASAQQSFTVSGKDLKADIIVQAPVGFEVSTTSGSNFSPSVSLTQNNGNVETKTIYVRMAASATGMPSGNITCASTGVPTQNVAINGTVNASVTSSVTISANPSNIVSPGTNVTFSATPTNGGTAPRYQWKKNGSNVATNQATYTDATLTTNDVIQCIMTSNAACATPIMASSNDITMTVCDCNPECRTVPTTAGTYDGAFSNTDANGVTHYCDAAGNILLSTKPVTPGTTTTILPSAVHIKIDPTPATFYPKWCGGTTVADKCFMVLTSNALINRRWHIDAVQNTPISETNQLQISFYFKDAEYNALNALITPALASSDALKIYLPSEMTNLGAFPNPSLIKLSTIFKYSYGTTPSHLNWAKSVPSTGTVQATFHVKSIMNSGGIGKMF